jgi:hypothetical protein
MVEAVRAFLILVAGCWTGAAPEVAAPVAPAPMAAVRVEPALPRHSVWTGRYLCPQGVTGVTLALEIDAAGGVVATFEFGPLPENPSIPSGSSILRGEAAIENGAVAIRLVPDRWIDQPTGYVMVPMALRGTRPLRALHGMIDAPGCTDIDVTRSS